MPRRMASVVFLLSVAGFPFSSLVAQEPSPNLEVASLWCDDPGGERRSGNECRIGDRLVVETPNLHAWIAPEAGRTPANLSLVLNGHVLQGGIHVVLSDTQLAFWLRRNADNEVNTAAWKMILGRSKLVQPRRVMVALAPEGSHRRYGTKAINLVVTSRAFLTVVLVVFFFLVVVFLILAWKSGLIRDPGVGAGGGPDATRPFSLARAQMAWWFFLVIGAFLYLWVVTGHLDTLTSGVLALIGISAGTGFTSAMADSSKRSAASGKRQALERDKAALVSRVRGLDTLIDQSPPRPDVADLTQKRIDLEARLAQLKAELAELGDPDAAPVSRGFIQDILRGDGGIAFHRFQIVAWTVVLGVVFARSVYTELSMPEFDVTLLGLMGISSGTYLGFKFPGGSAKQDPRPATGT